MRCLCIFLLTLLLGSSLAIQNSNGNSTPATPTNNKEEVPPNHNGKRDSSSATSVPTSNTGYRYSTGPAHHYLPPSPQSAPTPAPSHQHQEEGYKYQAPVEQLTSFSLGGSGLFQHASPENLPAQAPSYYVPKAETPNNSGGYYTPSYFVPRPPKHTEVSQSEKLEHNKGYEYAKPAANQFAGYQYKQPEQSLNIGHSSSNSNYGQQKAPTSSGNHIYNKIPNYAKPQIPSHVGTSTSNGNDNIYKYPVSPSETTNTKDDSFSHGYIYQRPASVSSQSKEESFASHRQPFTGSNTAALEATSKPLFEAATGNEVYNGFNYKQEQPRFETEATNSNSFGQNSYLEGNSYLNKPAEDTQANKFASNFNFAAYPQQTQNTGYAYGTPTQISTQIPTQNSISSQTPHPLTSFAHNFPAQPASTFDVPHPGPVGSFAAQTGYAYGTPTQIPTQSSISSQTPHPLTSFAHNFPAQPASTFDLPHPGPVGSFAAQTAAIPAPTFLQASTQHGTPSTQHYAGGHEELGGYYSHALTKPLEHNPLDYARPSSQLLAGESYAQQSAAASANGIDYLQMQSQSYQLPSYFTMQMETPAEQQQQFQLPQEPQEFSYHSSSPNTQTTFNSYDAPTVQHHLPHAVYGTPNVEATQATPAHAYLPPSGQFQPPHLIK